MHTVNIIAYQYSNNFDNHASNFIGTHPSSLSQFNIPPKLTEPNIPQKLTDPSFRHVPVNLSQSLVIGVYPNTSCGLVFSSYAFFNRFTCQKSQSLVILTKLRLLLRCKSYKESFFFFKSNFQEHRLFTMLCPKVTGKIIMQQLMKFISIKFKLHQLLHNFLPCGFGT